MGSIRSRKKSIDYQIGYSEGYQDGIQKGLEQLAKLYDMRTTTQYIVMKEDTELNEILESIKITDLY